MADQEVESILLEIRERVRSAPPAPAANFTGNVASQPASASNGDREAASESLRLIESYLTTTGRAWDRLPPLVSNRSGASARVELWIKRQLKRAMHWFTWEQVNFNAAVHHALETLKQENERQRVAFDEQRALNAEQRARDAEQHARDAEQRVRDAEQHARDAEQHVRAEEGLRNEIRILATQQAGLLQELRERDEHLLNEQRVCFKQLSLETSEAAVLEDRARRKTEAVLVELRRRIDEMEKK